MPPFGARIIVSASAAALLLTPWVAGRALAAALLIGLLPGITTLPLRNPGDRIGPGIALAFSPLLFVALVLPGLLAPGSFSTAAALGFAGWTVAYAARGAAPSRGSLRPTRLALFSAATIAAAAAAWIGPALLDTGWILRGGDGLGAAVAGRLLRTGLPVIDPWFSPLRLDVSYAYHAVVASVASATGAGLRGAAAMVNCTALAGFGAAFVAIAGLFVRRLWPRVLALVLALFTVNGLNGFGVVSPAALVPGPLCVLMGLMAAARLGWWNRRLAIAWTLVFPALLLGHIHIGLLVLAVTLATLGFQHVIRAHPEKGGPEYATLVGLALAGSAATIPYLWSALPNGGPPVHFGWQGASAFSMHLIGPTLIAIAFMRWQPRRDHPPPGERELVTGRLYAGFSLAAAGLLGSWLVGVMVLSLLVGVRGEAVFTWPLFIPMAVFAAGGLERMWNTRGGRVLAVVLVLMSITVSLMDAIDGFDRTGISEHERAVYRWIQRSSPEDAVFFESDDVVRVPALGVRDQYWGSEAGAALRSCDNDERVARRRMRDAVYSNRGISMEQAQILRELDRPVFVVYRSRPDDLYDASQIFRDRPAYEGRFATPTISVYELQLNP